MLWIKEERHRGEIVILDLRGVSALDDGSEEALRDGVERRVQSGSRKILLNLAEVPYIDSQSLADLLRASTLTRQAGGSLKLSAVSARIRELFKRTRVSRLIEVFDSEQEALESFESATSS